MRVIICPKCGKIPYYTNFEIQKVYIAFDANGEELDIPLDTMGIRSSVVKRCYYCNSQVRIREVKDNEDHS